jgi:hypothetical protein
MKIGDLVKMTKARIGVPRDTIGLITEYHHVAAPYQVFIVQLMKVHPKYGTRTIRRLARDMEVINASR